MRVCTTLVIDRPRHHIFPSEISAKTSLGIFFYQETPSRRSPVLVPTRPSEASGYRDSEARHPCSSSPKVP